MKNAQNEFGKSAEKSLSANTTTTTATATTINTITTTSTTAPTVEEEVEKETIRLSAEITDNVHNNNNNNNNATVANAAATSSPPPQPPPPAASSTATTTTPPPLTTHATVKMTNEHTSYEHKSDNKGSSNSSISNNINNNNNNNSSIIAEAAKILLKNGLNGTNAAAAALFAAQTFQLPTFPALVSISTSGPGSASSPESSSLKESVLVEPPPAHVASTSKMSASTSVSTVIALGHSPHSRNNGLPTSTHFKAKELFGNAATSATSASGVNLVRKSVTASDANAAGVIDCSVGNAASIGAVTTTASNGTHKILTSNSAFGNAAGGRLQFFKDGKFILELARSKDGERGGWVSVPRKQFRTPSACSSTVTPASTANACVYSKIESSTSFSFSDDNSSIQSSPWQRDHCWKQATPKRNISKEMSLFYQLPFGHKLNDEGLRVAKLKRRRPLDNTKIDIKRLEMFEKITISRQQFQTLKVQQEIPNGKTTTKLDKEELKEEKEEDEDRHSTSSVATLVGENDSNDNEQSMESIDVSSIETTAKAKPEELTTKNSTNIDAIDKTVLATNAENNEAVKIIEKTESDSNKMDIETANCGSTEIEKMNTSDDDDGSGGNRVDICNLSTMETECIKGDQEEKAQSTAVKVVEDKQEQKEQQAQQEQKSLTPTPVKSKTGVEDKRLISKTTKKRIERAKLTTIVQKLIDQMPARCLLPNVMKTPTTTTSSSSLFNSSSVLSQQHQHQTNNNFSSNKVSPTLSSSRTSTSPLLNSCSMSTAGCAAGASATAVGTATQRLVEYHQQHVSPRKRILREFEKVSLDDNNMVTSASSTASSGGAAITGAGGKRSRAKSSTNTTAISTNYRNARSPSNRVQSSVCNVPTAASLSSSSAASLALSTTSTSTATNGESVFKLKQPSTKLYSSYSIHSLLADNNNSSSKSISPKSPETGSGGGKSPSNAAGHKKRSPPYASPLREAHSRSPNIVGGSGGECPPPIYKQRYDAPGLINVDHQTQQHQSYYHQRQLQLQLQQQQQGAFYSPYLVSSSSSSSSNQSALISSKYVPGGMSSASSTATAASASPPITATRSPRHSSYNSCTATTSTATTPTHSNIPNAQSRTLLSSSYQREISPPPPPSPRPPSTSTLSRDSSTTPRTVPKKTASIRRQFASPTSSSSSNSHHVASSNNNCSSSCPSPVSAINVDERDFMENKSNANAAATAAAAAAAYQHLLHRQTSSVAAAAAAAASQSPLHPAAYYMYPPSPTSSPHPTTAAAPPSPYIPAVMPPSYYHSYISALNITKHYYMGAGASPQSAAAAAAARLSPPFHHLGIPYNGIAMAAAAAAAFSNAQPPSSPSPHHLATHQHATPMLPPAAAAFYGSGASGLNMLGSGPSSYPSSSSDATNSTVSATTTHKNIGSNLSAFHNSCSSVRGGGGNGETAATMRSQPAHTQHFHNIKDEQSSDVPLNLSKH